MGRSLPIYAVSDGAGGTARTVVRAVLHQFPGEKVEVTVLPHVLDMGALEHAFLLAARHGGVVVSTLVRDDLRAASLRLGAEHAVQHVDLLGPLLDQLHRQLATAPRGDPGPRDPEGETAAARVDAIEFAMLADDGRAPEHVAAADLVLAGVSRTGKTPLSTLLAHHGLRVANQPLVLDRPPPPALLARDPADVFLLTIDPEALRSMRHARLRELSMPDDAPYADPDVIAAELEQAVELAVAHGWRTVDVTGRALEEVAADVLRMRRGA